MGIMRGILDAAFEAAEKAGEDRISAIHLSIGEMTEIQDFALEFAFEALTPGTPAEGASLVMTFLPPHSRCKDCGAEFDHDRYEMLCPVCKSFDLQMLTGRELRIDAIDTPDETDAAAGADGGAAADTPHEA